MGKGGGGKTRANRDGRNFGGGGPQVAGGGTFTESELEKLADNPEALRAFVEERHLGNFDRGLIPLYAVKDYVASRFGEGAASLDKFHSVVRGARSEGKVRTLNLSDSRDATDRQQAAGLPGLSSQVAFWLRRSEK